MFSTPLPSRGNRQFFAVGFPADCLRVLPAASSEGKLAKDPKKPSSGPSGFDFLYWGNGGYHSREAAFCIFSIPDDSDFSLRKNRGERHQERRRKTFFAKSFSLCNLPQGDCKFTFQKCALRIGCFALCGGRPGLLALDLARLSLDAIRVYSKCEQQSDSTRSQPRDRIGRFLMPLSRGLPAGVPCASGTQSRHRPKRQRRTLRHSRK